jgi:hypothetical protein
MAVAAQISGIDCYKVKSRTGVGKASIDLFSGVDNSPPPTLYYTMETGSGTTVVDRSESENEHDAEFGAGAAALAWYSADPAFGTYSVAAATGDYADITDHADLDWEYNTPWTMQAWVATTSASYAGIYVKREATGADYRGPAVFITDGQVYIYLISIWTSATILAITSGTAINDGAWHSVIVTYDGSGDASGVQCYIDGSNETLSAAYDSLGTSTMVNNVAPHICNTSETNTLFLAGLDEFAIWPVELTAGQVSVLYNSGTAIDVARGI